MDQTKVMVAVGLVIASASIALALEADTLDVEDEASQTSITTIQDGVTVPWVWQEGVYTLSGPAPATGHAPTEGPFPGVWEHHGQPSGQMEATVVATAR